MLRNFLPPPVLPSSLLFQPSDPAPSSLLLNAILECPPVSTSVHLEDLASAPETGEEALHPLAHHSLRVQVFRHTIRGGQDDSAKTPVVQENGAEEMG